MRVLFLASNPPDTQRLALGEEARAIRYGAQLAEHGRVVDMRTRWAVRADELQQLFLDLSPHVVHFAGHGNESGEILFHTGGTEPSPVSKSDLARHFGTLRGSVQLVVFNTCDSEPLAQAIAEFVDAAIGMSGPIEDEAARAFAVGLYRGLASDKAVQTAFDMGLDQMGLKGQREYQQVPKLWTRPGVDAAQVFPLRQSQPSIEILTAEPVEAPSLDAEFRIRLDLDEQKTTVWVRGEPLGDATWQTQPLQRAMSRFSESRGKLVRGTGKEAGLLRQAGESLFEALLSEDLGASFDQALGKHLKVRGAVASLVFEVTTPQAAALPVETLISPNHGVLGSHQRMRLFRRAWVGDAPPVPEQLPAPPLRVLFVVSSPDSSSQKGNLLDFELEEWVMLRALQPLISKGHAILETLEEGSLDAVEEALESETFHVLHYTGHGSPGHLHMEGRDGEEDEVPQEKLAELLMRFSSLRLVVLSGCSTANPTQRIEKPSSDSTTEGAEVESGQPEVLQGLALALSELGIPFVIGMQESVPDTAATLWAEAFYRHLVRHDADVPAAFQAGRHLLKQLEQEQPPEQGNWGQWPLPVLYQRGAQTDLFDTDAMPDRSRAELTPTATLYEGIARLGAGRFIGRRALRRQLSRRLREPAVGALLLYGLGGIGKSALATQLAETFRRRSGATVLALRAPLQLNEIISQFQQLLHGLSLQLEFPEQLRQLFQALLSKLGPGSNLEPVNQMELVIAHLASNLPILLFLDNFEDELEWVDDHWQVKNPELARVLALWAQQPGPSKLLITSRYPFQLDGLSPTRFETRMVGPLDQGESRKLMLRFPALRALGWQELGAIHERIGGHPRSIEYLAAKLEHGDATWGQFGAELDRSLLERQIDPEQLHWGDDGEVLQETATHAVGDILLDSLLEELDADAEDLLRRASVYRQPVGVDALSWLREGRDVSREIGLLIQLSLLYCDNSSERTLFLVHRVTAESLLNGAPQALQDTAHHAAAECFEHRASHVSKSLVDYLEARWHWLQCGNVERASEIAVEVQKVLHRWGYWTQAKQLSLETWELERVSQATRASAAHTLGIFHQLRGDYDDALNWYKKSLAILEELENKDGMASSYHQIGWISELRGDYDDALNWHKKSLAITEELGNQASMANSYHHMGNVSCLRGDYGNALTWYKKSLAIEEELGNQDGMASSYHQIGIISELRGDYDDALKWYKKSMAIKEALGNQAGLASSYHQIGLISQYRGDYDDALTWYKKSLAILEELRNKAGLASSYHQIGRISELRSDYDEALEWYKKSLAIEEELGNKAGLANSYGQIGRISELRGDYEEALNGYKKALRAFEEMGDRAGMATTFSQIGILLADQDQVAEAVPLNLQSLIIRMEMQVPEVAIDIRQLHRQEELLGAESFRSILIDQLGEDDANALIEQLHALKEAQADDDETNP